MSNNNVPTGPGLHYRREPGGIDVSKVFRLDPDDGKLYYVAFGWPHYMRVQDDGLWAGPVPMPGEWAPRKLFDDLWYEAARLSPPLNTKPREALLKAAIKWTNENPAPEVTR